MTEEQRESSFDALAKGMASGSVSRGKALRLMGAALIGGTLAAVPGLALAKPKPGPPPGPPGGHGNPSGGHGNPSGNPGGGHGGGGGGGGGGEPVSCGQNLCTPSLSPLSPESDPCVATVCAADSYCCETSWDQQCVNEATSFCGCTC